MLERLRLARSLARRVLACFALSIGAAAASPWIAPTPLQLVCSAQGVVKLVAVDHDGGAVDASAHAADCAVCLPLAAPPPRPMFGAVFDAPRAPSAARVVDAAFTRRFSAGPPPARAPPRSA